MAVKKPKLFDLMIERGPVTVQCGNVPLVELADTLVAAVKAIREANVREPCLTPDLGHVGGSYLPYTDDEWSDDGRRRLGFR